MPAQLLIIHFCLEKPGIYLHEIQKELEYILFLEVSLSTICRFLHNSKFTRQKLRTTALQQDEFLRLQFRSDVSVYSPEMLVFVDETGADRRNLPYASMATVYVVTFKKPHTAGKRGTYFCHCMHICCWTTGCEDSTRNK